MLSSRRVALLAARGGRTQRVLWASTSAKNPRSREVFYVEELIGPDTIDTLPPATLEAFRRHGQIHGATVTRDLGAATITFARLRELGIDMESVGRLLETLARKRSHLLSQPSAPP